MVRLIALVQADCAIVEIDATVCRQRLPFLQMEQHRRVRRRSTLHALKRGRETAHGTENFWMIQQSTKSIYRGVPRSPDPTCRRGVEQSEAFSKSGYDCNRIGGNIRHKHFCHDHLRQHSLHMKFGNRFLGLQSRGQHQENRKLPDRSLFVGSRQKNGDFFSFYRDCFNGFRHQQPVTLPYSLSNL